MGVVVGDVYFYNKASVKHTTKDIVQVWCKVVFCEMRRNWRYLAYIQQFLGGKAKEIYTYNGYDPINFLALPTFLKNEFVRENRKVSVSPTFILSFFFNMIQRWGFVFFFFFFYVS